MTLRSQIMIGLIATASFPLISFGTDATNTASAPRIYSETEIAYIRGINCDTFTSDAKAQCLDIKKSTLSQSTTAAGNTPSQPVRSQSGSEDRHLPVPLVKSGTGSEDRRLPVPPVRSQSGDEDRETLVSQSGTTPTKPAKPPMGTGAMMESGADKEHQIQGLGMAISRLTPTDRDTLVKMIREYLTSKGLTLGAPEVKKNETERKGWDGSIKGKKTDTEIQAERAALIAKREAKREAMRKEYAGHVTLMK